MSLVLSGDTGVTTPSGAVVNAALTRGTAVASTSGTSIDFTSIPSWAKRITVMFSGVSTNGTSLLLIRIGTSGGVETTGYSSGASHNSSTSGFSTSTAGFVISVAYNSTATSSFSGSVQLSLLNANTWSESGSLFEPTYGVGNFVSGAKTLTGTLDRVRITTVNGTDTFDAGSINILYE